MYRNDLELKSILNNVLYFCNNNYTFKEIQKTLKITRNELLRALVLLNIDMEYIKDNIAEYKIKNNAIVISDTHLGGINSNIDYVNYVYDFALKNDIKNIIHTGDILNGSEKYSTSYKNQIEDFLKKYPDKKVDTYYILGNHDYKFYEKGYQLDKIIDNRKDMHFLGISKGYIRINNNLLFLSHKVKKYHLMIPKISYTYCLKGHSHYYNQKDNIYSVPMLSDYYITNNENNEPGFLIIDNDGIKQYKLFNNYSKISSFEVKQKIKYDMNPVSWTK